MSTKKRKWLKVKANTVDYFKTISIPGVSQIVTTESYLLKLLWTVVILCVFGFGFDNISQAVADYYKYDVITNIERVTPENVTFPAITLCTLDGYWRDHYRDGRLVINDRVKNNSNLLKQFIIFTFFYSDKNGSYLRVDNHLDFFKTTTQDNKYFLDCFKFNAIKNKSVELFKATTTVDGYLVSFKNFYIEKISENQYYNYSLIIPIFYGYIGENSLKSSDKMKYFVLNIDRYHQIEIIKESVETKLPEPYNSCKESSVNEPYHQLNCIETCIYREIKNKYNCTFCLTLFSIQGLRECEQNFKILKTEFSVSCLKECPLESCFSEKYTEQIKTENRNGLTALLIQFRDFNSLNITQIPKTDSFTFLNNIGGGLGLFMGIAFPNLIEFLQFIVEIFLILFIQRLK